MSSDTYQKYLSQTHVADQYVDDIRESRHDLHDALMKLEGSVVSSEVPTISELTDGLGSFSANVALIGQVKAGKTALVNALLGVSDLLPSDVNPWTSVVTSVHINCPPPQGKRAIFKFFEENDWQDLVSDGGRIIKLAKKAKLDTQLDELSEQIATLKERTEKRLGKNFKLLLGNKHAFSNYNADLIKRYVCLGEDDISEDREGRFADMTKSADIYLENKQFDYPVTLADTPGVNDPFLVREAATLQNLGNCDVCIVVLSASQALSSVDLGLVRMLKSLKSKRLIAFVNRIDELPDPHTQIQEIRDYITGVLQKQKLDENIPIIFGSAAWADAAITGNFEDLPEDSQDSLASLIEQRAATLDADAHDDENINNLADISGIRALRSMINQKVWEEVYQPKVAADASRARRIAERSILHLSGGNDAPDFDPNPEAVDATLSDMDALRVDLLGKVNAYRDAAQNEVKMQMARAYVDFIHREKRNLTDCLSGAGKVKDWLPDTEGLRSELNGIYSDYDARTASFFVAQNDDLIKEVQEAYQRVLGTTNGIGITPQPIPDAPVPLSLMRTMSVDLRASSSFEWLRRKLDKSVYLDQFEAIANEDMRSSAEEICDINIAEYLRLVAESLTEFLDEHSKTIRSFGAKGREEMRAQLGEMQDTDGGLVDRLSALRDGSDILLALETSFVDAPEPQKVATGVAS